jgi:hypothetical protein
MKMLLFAFLGVICVPTFLYGQGSVVVRIDNPVESHCIDATSESVTLHVRRVFTEKSDSLFTEDKRAGVVLTARLIGTGTQGDTDVKIPSVSLVNVKDEHSGRVSLALEYNVASYLQLNKSGVLTTEMQLSLSSAKRRGKTTFGDVLDLAGQIFTQLPIPTNPYSEAASKFLKFANDAIGKETTGDKSVPFGEISLSFNRGPQPNLNKCKSDGKERTGAFAVLMSTGLKDAELIPTTNTEQLYCFSYSSGSSYEILAAKKVNGVCPTNPAAYQGVNNDYTLFLMSAGPNRSDLKLNSFGRKAINESIKRCKLFGISEDACGIGPSEKRRLGRY